MKRNYTYHTPFLLILSVLLFMGFGSFGQGRLEKFNLVNDYDYIVFFPEGYDNSSDKSNYSLLVYLHGGNAVKDVIEFNDFSEFSYGIPALIDGNKWEHDNFIVVVPRLPCSVWRENGTCRENENLWVAEKVNNVIEDLTFDYNPQKIYFTGISLGAKGVWDYAISYDEVPAAIAPISGNAFLTSDLCNLEDIPIWAFHGDSDPQVPPDATTNSQGRSGTYMLIDYIETNCSPAYAPRTTKFLYKAHEADVWENIYDLSSGYNIYDWFTSHTKGAITNIAPFVRIVQPDQAFLIEEKPITLLLTSDVFDSNIGSDLIYNWTFDENYGDKAYFRAPNNQILVNPISESVFVEFKDVGSYRINLTVDDGISQRSDQAAITINSTSNGTTISHFELFDADQNKFLKVLKNGDKIETDILNADNFNVRAIVEDPTKVQNILFTVEGNEKFSLVSDFNNLDGSKYFAFPQKDADEWRPADGEYVISATPYANKNPARNPGISKQLVIYVNEEPPIILPVEFLDFNARRIGNKVSINWSTASEQGNDFFTIERSPIASDHFEGIGTQKGARDSKELNTYTFTDYAPLAGEAYYRIKQTDVDGQSTYSKIVHANGKDVFSTFLFPNPTEKNNINIQLSSADPYSEVNLHVIDAIGNVVDTKILSPEVMMMGRGYRLQLTNNLSPGLYFVIVNQGVKNSKQKLIVR